MGCFSWMYADKDNKKPLNIGDVAYVICPDGNIIKETNYDGYGMFGGYDIYELVLDWNKPFLSVASLNPPIRSDWDMDYSCDDWYKRAIDEYIYNCHAMNDYLHNKSDAYMIKNYGKHWKRHLGIKIACDDEYNMAIKYPIKICRNQNFDYSSLPASLQDPNQGLGSEWSYT